jgi:hypothetical protein
MITPLLSLSDRSDKACPNVYTWQTGGEDDLVSMWSFSEMRLIARGEGHSSWVTAVAFDPWNCDSDEYRCVLRAAIPPLGLYIALSDSPVFRSSHPPDSGL